MEDGGCWLQAEGLVDDGAPGPHCLLRLRHDVPVAHSPSLAWQHRTPSEWHPTGPGVRPLFH